MKMWIKHLFEGPATIGNSLSDNGKYPIFCLKASSDPEIFANFRRNKEYREILEHTSEEQGLQYLKETSDILLSKIDFLKENDIYGNPILNEYPKIGKISPSTLRYIKIASDLVNIFGGLKDFKICEIGVGYGGQCRIIDCIATTRYTLADIVPALALTRSFLDNYPLNSSVEYMTMNELQRDDYDLVISNYAFSELPRKLQDVYMKKAILNSKRGYMIMNQIAPPHFKSYTKEELLKIIPNSRILEEKPLTHRGNYLIVWN